MNSSFNYDVPEISPFVILIWLALVVFFLACYWRIFTKAGRPGIYSIIPILNLITLLDIAGLSCLFIIGFFIPVVNFVVLIYFYYKFAQAFGQGGLFAAGLIFLPFIFFPLLAFGDYQYVGDEKIKRDFGGDEKVKRSF